MKIPKELGTSSTKTSWNRDRLLGCILAMDTLRRSFLVTFFSLLVLASAFAAGFWAHRYYAQLPDTPILVSAFRLLEQHSLQEMPEVKTLEYGMIHGMVQAYGDPYTMFVEPVQHELESNSLQGSFGGIGAGLEVDPEGYLRLYPYPDSPASAAGMNPGDRLLAVDGLSFEPFSPIADIQSAIRGPVGRQVVLTLGRPPDYEPFTVRVRRAEIQLPSVTWRLAVDAPSIGIIQVNLIAATTAQEIRTAAEDLVNQGAATFILDLRDNPGGLLTAGVDVARLFLREGEILQQQYRGRDVETFRVERPGAFPDIPLIVLTNHGSASAAEIVAGALQVNGRAEVAGSPTFGKDTIQLVFELPDKSSLHVTSARWWIPGLEPPIGNGVGVQPDLPVNPPDDTNQPDPVIEAAINALLEQE